MSAHPPFFPLWVVVTHFLNIFFMLLLARSGLEVLSAFPKLYWHDDSPPGRQWLRLSKKTFGADSRRPWTTLDEEVSWSPTIALPGRKNLGLGRHWHFMTVQFWILTGAVYVALIFATGCWLGGIPAAAARQQEADQAALAADDPSAVEDMLIRQRAQLAGTLTALTGGPAHDASPRSPRLARRPDRCRGRCSRVAGRSGSGATAGQVHAALPAATSTSESIEQRQQARYDSGKRPANTVTRVAG